MQKSARGSTLSELIIPGANWLCARMRETNARPWPSSLQCHELAEIYDREGALSTFYFPGGTPGASGVVSQEEGGHELVRIPVTKEEPGPHSYGAALVRCVCCHCAGCCSAVHSHLAPWRGGVVCAGSGRSCERPEVPSAG
jgi:hypothetical protein